MVKPQRQPNWSKWLCMGLGACLSFPIWQAPWSRWQAHREREAQQEALEVNVRELTHARQQHPAQTSAPAHAHAQASWPAAQPHEVRAALQRLAQAQGIAWRSMEMTSPRFEQGAWLCPFDLRADGAVLPWLRWWQSVVQQQPETALVAWRIHDEAANGPRLQVQLQLPCRIEPVDAPTQVDDPFSLSAWQTLHAQRAQAHPSFQALAARWQQPRTALERFTLDHVHYVGRLYSAHKQMAILQVRGASPEVQTHSVEVGQALGAHLGTVVRVDTQAVEVQEWRRDDAGVWRRHTVRLPWEGDAP